MKRNQIRALKRGALRDKDVNALSMLLLHSVSVGHRRLALIRCFQAELAGVEIPMNVLSYCDQIACEMTQEELEKILTNARENLRK